MAIEHHSNHHTPDSCADEDAYTYSQVISFVALNDSAIAEYLAIQFAMPTFYTDIKISEQVFPHGRTETWTIGNSSDSIEVNLVNHGQGGATGVLVERLFWFNDTHLGFTDLELSYETDAGGLTWGSMQAPSIISETKPTPPYVGVGGTIDELVIEAPITLYEGFDCKKQVV